MAKKVSDEQLLEALLVHGGVRGAAGVCGISQNAIYKRLQDNAFRSRYDALQGVLVSSVAGYMATALSDAVEALVSVLNDSTTSSGLKVSAANALLSHTIRYVETASILRRLDALEQMSRGDNDA